MKAKPRRRSAPREKISATVITLNEEVNLVRCLESLGWADEIVVVDSFSQDKTVEIARRYADKVVQREWPGYIAQKNCAVDCCSNNWIFGIDADEQVSSELASSILHKAESGLDMDGYAVSRKSRYLGKWIKHGEWYPDFKVRLFDRRKGCWGGIEPHDKVVLKRRPEKLPGHLLHYPYPDLRAHLRQINLFTTISAREHYRLGYRPSVAKVVLNPFSRFLKGYLLRTGCLDGFAGFALAALSSVNELVRLLKLWELYYCEGSRPQTEDPSP